MRGRPRLAAIAAGFAAIALSTPTLAADDGVLSGVVRYGDFAARPLHAIPGIGTVVIPASSIERPGDIGVRAHTHSRVLIPDTPVAPPALAALAARTAAVSPLISVTETPASLACVYRLVSQTFGCNPAQASTVASGGNRAIAIVDAFHNKTSLGDLRTFSTHFGLPAPNLQVVYCSASSCAGVTTPPPVDTGWALEIALDLQAAHTMAPHAKLILVEAHSNSYVDLLRAEDRASELVAAAGGGQVSNSWGGSEFSSETGFDSHFVRSKVVFLASTGDHKGGTNVPDIEYPSVSRNVVAVGGTTIVRTSSRTFSKEQAWVDGGGGISAFVSRPSYQNVVSSRVGTHRGVPDVSADADPASGMWVYCQATSCGGGPWWTVGGTSLAAPLIAGIMNNAANFRSSSTAELSTIYTEISGPRFNDITSGRCGNGPNGSFTNAIGGWDRCTGAGTPKGKTGL